MTAKTALRLRLTNESAVPRLPRSRIRTLLADAWVRRGRGVATLNLLVLDDARIAVLNRTHLRHDGPTDVLAFDDGDADPSTGVLHLGDVAVSAETAAREAAARNVPFRDELALYALHGFLHILGFRDKTDAERAAMLEAQREEFRRQGWPTEFIE